MDSRLDEASRHLNQTVWCAACHLRIATYDLRTVFNGQDYHRHCFHKMVRKSPDLVPQKPAPDDDDE